MRSASIALQWNRLLGASGGLPCTSKTACALERSTASQDTEIASQASSPHLAAHRVNCSPTFDHAACDVRNPQTSGYYRLHQTHGAHRHAGPSAYGTCRSTLPALCNWPTATAALRATDNALRHPLSPYSSRYLAPVTRPDSRHGSGWLWAARLAQISLRCGRGICRQREF